MILESGDWSSGSKLNHRVPVNIVGSYGMTEILDLSSYNLTSLISIPSIMICPSTISTILLNDKQMVLLPAPVLPTTPIFSPLLIEKERFLRTVSVFGLYLRLTSLN